jgi:hypothetical protein
MVKPDFSGKSLGDQSLFLIKIRIENLCEKYRDQPAAVTTITIIWSADPEMQSFFEGNLHSNLHNFLSFHSVRSPNILNYKIMFKYGPKTL